MYKPNKIYVVEPLCKGVEHSQINSRFLRMLMLVDCDKQIQFYGEEKHISKVSQNLIRNGVHTVQSIPIKLCLSKTPISIIKNIVILSGIMLRALGSKNPVFILSCNKYLYVVIKVVVFIYRKPTILVLHGFINELQQPTSCFFNLKKLIKFGNRYIPIKYFVNGDFVYKNLIKCVPELSEKTHVVNLPIENRQIPVDYKTAFGTNIKIGCAGVACETKGSDKFFEITKSFKKISSIQFYYIGSLGKIKSSLIAECDSNVIIYRDEISDSQYDSILSEMDFLIFFYPFNSYNLGFSGVFLDCIRLCKPIIALKCNLFSFYFEKYGMMGWLFDDVTSLNKFLSNIRDITVICDYNSIISNIVNAQRDFDISAVAEKVSKTK